MTEEDAEELRQIEERKAQRKELRLAGLRRHHAAMALLTPEEKEARNKANKLRRRIKAEAKALSDVQTRRNRLSRHSERTRAPTREDVYGMLRDAKELAEVGGRPNVNAVLKAIELLGKTQGVFVDVQRQENPDLVIGPEALLAKIDSLMGIDLVREGLRASLRRWDEQLGDGIPAGRPEVADAGLLQADAASEDVSRSGVH